MVHPMECPGIATWSGFALGELSMPHAAELEAHLLLCDRCASVLERTHTEDALVRDLRQGVTLARCLDEPRLNEVIATLRPLGKVLSSVSDTPVAGVGGATWPTSPNLVDFEPPERPDELGRLGVYRILKEIGRGGMGDVFLAEDPRLGRQVAVKILRDAGQRLGRMARFLNECRTLARLEHPNIIRIFDMGEHHGRPWFVMEYIPDGTLADVLNGVPQPPDRAVDLLVEVVEAVESAHQRGVVHRDLKPANVLMAYRPSGTAVQQGGAAAATRSLVGATPKVTDFGLAKPLGDVSETQAGEVLGTPAYMAPEATVGNALERSACVRLDVYSLGVILYEMLTGRPPFRAASVLETLEQVRDREPVAPRRLVASIPRDLETICLKCLSKDPLRRYSSAQALADDLIRFRERRPILARPVGWFERGWKAVRRHPALAAVVTFAAMLLMGGGLIHQTRMAQALARAEAGEAMARQEQVTVRTQYHAARTALQQMLDSLDDRALAATPRMREVQKKQWEAALAFYKSLRAIRPDASVDMKEDFAAAAFEAGRVQAFLGQYESAAASFRQALAEFEELARVEPARVRHRARAATSLTNLAMMLAALRQEQASQDLLHRSILLREALVREYPNVAEYQNDLAGSHHLLGTRLHLTGRDPKTAYETSVGIRERLLRQHPADSAARSGLADTLVNLSLVYQHSQEPSRAVAAATEARRLLTELTQEEPDRLELAYSLGAAISNLAYVWQHQGRNDQQVHVAGEAIGILEKLLAQEPSYDAARQALLNAHGLRAQGLSALQRYSQAVPDWDRAIELARPDQTVRLRLQRIEVLAHVGQHELVQREAAELAPRSHAFAYIASHWAHVFTTCVRTVARDATLNTSEKRLIQGRLAQQAAAILRDLIHANVIKPTEANKLAKAGLADLIPYCDELRQLQQELRHVAAKASWFLPE
jgi:tetratricopeptide (TPR) repeat protein